VPRYEDFTVELMAEGSERVAAKVSCPLAGEARTSLPSVGALADLVAGVTQAPPGGVSASRDQGRRHLLAEPVTSESPSPGRYASDIGTALFEALFFGPTRSLLDRSLGSVDLQEGLGLRIKLKLDLTARGEAQLHSLPWELLYKPDSGDFLGLSRRTPIVRHVELGRPVMSQILPQALRVLVLVPEPLGLPTLDLARERENLEGLARSVKGLEVDFLEPPSLRGLRSALLEREIHALHLMGHGDFDPRTGVGLVHLEGADRRSESVSAEALATVIKDIHSLRLVVLNACNSGRAGWQAGLNPFSGLAPALIRAGLPAVLAMQRPILNSAAIAFSEAFYRRLLAGDPVDTAVTEGRQAIYARDSRSADWAIPALFLRVPDGAIFGFETSRASTAKDTALRAISYLEAGDFEGAVRELREDAAVRPHRGLTEVALGIALGRGRTPRSLPYRTAVEMHRLFAAALASPEGGAAAAAALLALKHDYFERNSIREPPPSREAVLETAAGQPANEIDERLLECFVVSDDARELLVKDGILSRRGP
jgi:hypothetical protein